MTRAASKESPELKEGVMDTDVLKPQHLSPDARERRFDRRAGRHRGLRQLRPRPIRSGEVTTVDFAVW